MTTTLSLDVLADLERRLDRADAGADDVRDFCLRQYGERADKAYEAARCVSADVANCLRIVREAKAKAEVEASVRAAASEPATARLRYVRPDGKIKFRAVLKLARHERRANLNINSRDPSLAAIWAKWDRKSRIDCIMGGVKSAVGSELDLFGPRVTVWETHPGEFADTFRGR